MEVMLGYKQTEVGVIPEDWELKELGNIAAITAGGTPSRKNPEFWGGDIPWITTSQIDFNKITSAEQYITEIGLKNSAAKLLAPGTLLLALYGQGKTRGKVCILGIQAATNQACASIDISSSVSREFVFHFLASKYEVIRGLSNSGSQENLNGQIVKSIPIPLPPTRAEQEAIAEVLSKADTLIENLERLIAKKRLLKKGVMGELLTGKRRLYGFANAAIGCKQTEVGMIPEDWEVKAFGDLFDFSGGLSASRDQLSSEGYCYLHYGDIHKSSKTFIDVQAEYQDIPKLNVSLKRVSPEALLNDGDVVFVDASEDDEGTSKHIVIINKENIPYISGLHTIVAKSKSAALDHTYRCYCFQTTNIKRQFRYFAVGTKVSGISKTNIAKVVLPIPPLPEQESIGAILSAIDAEIALLKAQLAKYRQLKQGLMQKLLTGRIRLI